MPAIQIPGKLYSKDPTLEGLQPHFVSVRPQLRNSITVYNLSLQSLGVRFLNKQGYLL